MEIPPKASDCGRCSCEVFCVVFGHFFCTFMYILRTRWKRDYSGLKQPQVTANLILLDALKTHSLEAGAR